MQGNLQLALGDPGETRAVVAIAFNVLRKHLQWPSPEAVVIVELAVEDQRLFGFTVLPYGQHLVALALEMLVYSGFDAQPGGLSDQ